MEDQFVTYEIALKLKELGFNQPCLGFYNKKNEFLLNHQFEHYCSPFKIIKTPLWQQAIDWLRYLGVLFELFPVDSWYRWSYRISMQDIMSPFYIITNDIIEFTSYEEAREYGILEALKLIK